MMQRCMQNLRKEKKRGENQHVYCLLDRVHVHKKLFIPQILHEHACLHSFRKWKYGSMANMGRVEA